MEMNEIFDKIRDYHEILGFKPYPDTLNMQDIRNACLALYQEVSELTDSFPWKPWRKEEDQECNITNAIEEIVDCIFLLGQIMEFANIYPWQVEQMFLDKLKKNYDRIETGYNNKPDERG